MVVKESCRLMDEACLAGPFFRCQELLLAFRGARVAYPTLSSHAVQQEPDVSSPKPPFWKPRPEGRGFQKGRPGDRWWRPDVRALGRQLEGAVVHGMNVEVGVIARFVSRIPLGHVTRLHGFSVPPWRSCRLLPSQCPAVSRPVPASSQPRQGFARLTRSPHRVAGDRASCRVFWRPPYRRACAQR